MRVTKFIKLTKPYFQETKYKIIGSGHNIKEVNIKKKQRVKEIFISPICKYKNKHPLGIYKSRLFFEFIDPLIFIIGIFLFLKILLIPGLVSFLKINLNE